MIKITPEIREQVKEYLELLGLQNSGLRNINGGDAKVKNVVFDLKNNKIYYKLKTFICDEDGYNEIYNDDCEANLKELFKYANIDCNKSFVFR